MCWLCEMWCGAVWLWTACVEAAAQRAVLWRSRACCVCMLEMAAAWSVVCVVVAASRQMRLVEEQLQR